MDDMYESKMEARFTCFEVELGFGASGTITLARLTLRCGTIFRSPCYIHELAATNKQHITDAWLRGLPTQNAAWHDLRQQHYEWLELLGQRGS